ncbi:MAG: DUF2461 domain-containing protein [Candidatus Azobacteroides sp.]|nr:DUF2461 domain-containing protein [Candidatus Azobacteroides sp.]
MRSLNILYDFIKRLIKNNNREWFQSHKEEFEEVKKVHEEFISWLISEISVFDEDIRGMQAKDCIFRIYRDVRFSPDKSPYKNHLGAYIASRGGRKSERAGYYVHISPGESFVSGGIHAPQPKVLKAIREAVHDNIEEYLSITEEKEYKKYFTEFFGEPLKTVPKGFPKDFEYADLLKNRHYSPTSPLADTIWKNPDCAAEILKRCKALYPYNRFMNFTVDECLYDS